jgi:hypothetical protein
MPGKQSKLRYRTMLAEVSDKVQAALRTGVEANPFPSEDKRYARFSRQLAHAQRAAALFEL